MSSTFSVNKVFGIGLSHTATKSLNKALKTLGIPSIHWPVDRQTYRELSRGNYKLTILKKYKAVTDITVVPFYPQMDKVYPGSKFILTTRDKDAWMSSMCKINKIWIKYTRKNFLIKYALRFAEDFKDYGLGAVRSTWFRITHDEAIEFFRMKTYGSIAFEDEKRLSDVYDLHHKSVLEYFRKRPDDLLIMNITDGDGWEKLCPFLSKPIPPEDFPCIFDKRKHNVKTEVEPLEKNVHTK